MYNCLIKDLENINLDFIIKIIFSGTKEKEGFSKVTIRPIQIKAIKMLQVEKFWGNQVFHENIEFGELKSFINSKLPKYFKQINFVLDEKSISYKISKKGKLFKNEQKNKVKIKANLDHNMGKKYILKEGTPILPLIDLGIFDKKYNIIKSKFDKFKQINRFVEIIDDEFAGFKNDEITILDFGCGKSYLTFIVYYYFSNIKGIKVNIIGYDLKKDVVEECNLIAEKYEYSNLKFIVGDITKNVFDSKNVDMVITLHACDVATDYALYNAIVNNVKFIFSVPCCQHEINGQITNNDEFSILLNHGLIKERFSALLTDSIRSELLNSCGYKVDIIEFVDFEHSPKNLMIRARKCKERKIISENRKIYDLMDNFKIKHTLLTLLEKN